MGWQESLRVDSKKLLALILVSFIAGTSAFFFYKYDKKIALILEMKTSERNIGQIFWNSGNGYNENESHIFKLGRTDVFEVYEISLPGAGLQTIRIDPLCSKGIFEIKSIRLIGYNREYLWTGKDLAGRLAILSNISEEGGYVNGYKGIATTDDPALVLNNVPGDLFKKRTLLRRLLISSQIFIGVFAILVLLNTLVQKKVRMLSRTLSMRMLYMRSYIVKHKRIVNFTLSILLLMYIIALLVPFSPEMPVVADGEKFAMNYAIAKGFVIGRDVIYTYGPYAYIYSMWYYPETDFRMVASCLYLAFSFWLSLVILIKNTHWRWTLFLFLVSVYLYFNRDVLLLLIPFVVGLNIFKALVCDENKGLLVSKFSPIYVAILFAPLGLLPLAKGTLLLECAAVSIYCALFLAINRYKRLGIISLLSPIISLLFFWALAGQSMENLYVYFHSMNSIISGYSDAMSILGEPLEIIWFLVSAILLLAAIYTQKSIRQKYFLIGLYVIFLFISFKSGFVRHDFHAIFAALSLLMAALLLPFVGVKSKFSLFAISLAFFVLVYIFGNKHVLPSPKTYSWALETIYNKTFQGIKNRINQKDWLDNQYKIALNTIREKAKFPALQGSTDIYSYNQAYVLANDFHWSPRPAFQSYAAYTPELAEINKNHLQGINAPENIIFGIEPLDYRLPSMEDGASWFLLLTQYTPTKLIGHYLFLAKKTAGAHSELKWSESQKYHFGETVALPGSSGSIYAKIIVKHTLVGLIKNILFKSDSLGISLKMVDNSTKQFRLIPGMTSSGIMISPLIENAQEFSYLYSQDQLLDKNKVSSFSVIPGNGNTMDWDNEYIVVFSGSANECEAKIHRKSGNQERIPIKPPEDSVSFPEKLTS